MCRIFPIILLCLLLNELSAQTYPGTWNGAGYYVPGQPMTTVMQKMGGKKLIYLDINASNNITGSMVVTYDQGKATIANNGGDQVFVIAGKLDLNRQLLLLIVTHTKNGATEVAFRKPDSIYYSVELLIRDNKVVMAGGVSKANNRNATSEWIGSPQGQGLGMNINDNISMHMLPLNIKLENTYSLPPPSTPATTVGTSATGVSPTVGPLPEIMVDATVPRKKDIQRTIVLDTSLIKMDLYDNGEIDGDIATIILDGKVILDKQSLSTKAATLTLNLSKDISEHVLELFANNMGSIPPNTALLVLTCNRKRYEINLSSNGTVNGSVKLVFK